MLVSVMHLDFYFLFGVHMQPRINVRSRRTGGRAREMKKYL